MRLGLGRHKHAARYTAAVALAVAIVAAASLGARPHFGSQGIGVDDANIVLRYARNIVDGYGVVWNPHGERVEGFSSPLWLAIATAVTALTFTPEPALLWIGVIIVGVGIGTHAFACAAIADSSTPRESVITAALAKSAALSIVWILVSSPAYIVWSTLALLEGGLWSGLLMCTLWITVASIAGRCRAWPVGVLVATLVTVRPEALVIAPAFVALLLFGQVRRGVSIGLVVRRTAVPILCVVGTLGFLFVGRWSYFGFWLPNTYYCKVGDELGINFQQGVAYLASYLRANPVLFLVFPIDAAIALAWIAACCRARRLATMRADLQFDAMGAASVIALIGITSVVWVGGDHFVGWRLMQPYWPLLGVPIFFVRTLLAVALSPWSGPPTRRAENIVAWTMVGVACVSGDANELTSDKHEGLALEFELAERGRSFAQAMNTVFAGQRMPRLGVVAAGGIGYAYRGVSLDLMGLNDVAMAHATRLRSGLAGHAAFDVDTFFREAPDIVVSSGTVCSLRHPQIRLLNDWASDILKGVAKTSAFLELYEPVTVAYPGSTIGMAFCEWARRSFVEETDPGHQRVRPVNAPM